MNKTKQMETILNTLASNWEEQAQEFRKKEIEGVKANDLAAQYVNGISADRLEECAQELRTMIRLGKANENHLNMAANLINQLTK